jgi:hypothetical protein
MELGMTDSTNDIYLISGVLVGHEFTHSAQAGNFIGTPQCGADGSKCVRSSLSNSGFSPCWMFEGLPQAAGRGVVANSLADYMSYRDGLPYGWGSTTVTDYSQPSLYNYLFNLQDPATCYQHGDVYKLGYSIGALTTEALFAIDGPQAVMALYALGARGENFATAFKHVYGIEWQDAALTLSKVLGIEYAGFGTAPN